MTQTSVSQLVEKMKASGRYMPISDDEYKRLQCEQMSRLAAQAAANHKPDFSRLGLHESELKLSWNKISPSISDGKKAVDAVQTKYEQGHGMVFLWGTYGQAKTLTGKILVATAYRESKSAAYANVSSVLDDIRLAFDEKESKTTELLKRMDYWISRDVLFLDEIDKCNETDWARERIFQLLDQRYTRAIREEALTVIASNSKVEALDGYLASRLKDKRLGPVVYLNGQDGRQVMPEGWKF
jgi:DNA replication protein DnaC